MIKVENVEVAGFETAIRGMRNPMNSWKKSDSTFAIDGCMLGKNDVTLMRGLYDAGPEHRKYLRQIYVGIDITAPLFWWKEFDTYKVGVTRDSCSTMHKIHAKEFTLEDFSNEAISDTEFSSYFNLHVAMLESLRLKYLETSDTKYWRAMIELLPDSYNMRATVTMNYENVANMIRQRKAHKLDEWHVFTRELSKLPYIRNIIADYD